MVYAKLDNEPLNLGWLGFSIKSTAAIVWFITSLAAAQVVDSSGFDGWKRAIAGLVLVAPAFAWVRLSTRQLERSDEFDRNLLMTGLRLGNSLSVMFGPSTIGIIAIVSALPHGQAALPHGPIDLMRAGYLALFLQPPIAMLCATLTTQFARWTYGRKERK